MGGSDNEHHIWWVCKENKVKGDSRSFGGHRSELTTELEGSAFLLCFSPVATEPNREGACDVERMWKACVKQTHTQVFLTLRAPERQK